MNVTTCYLLSIILLGLCICFDTTDHIRLYFFRCIRLQFLFSKTETNMSQVNSGMYIKHVIMFITQV